MAAVETVKNGKQSKAKDHAEFIRDLERRCEMPLKELILHNEIAYVALKFFALMGLISIVALIFIGTCIALYRRTSR